MLSLSVEKGAVVLKDLDTGQAVPIPLDKIPRLTGFLDGVLYGLSCTGDDDAEEETI